MTKCPVGYVRGIIEKGYSVALTLYYCFATVDVDEGMERSRRGDLEM